MSATGRDEEGEVMGPNGPRPLPLRGSPQWSDNVGRMYLFTERHPEVKITVPRDNGTPDFIATWPDGRLTDRSLGWLMDRLEEMFRRDGPPLSPADRL